MAIIKSLPSKGSVNNIIKYVLDQEKTEERIISGKDCNPNDAIEGINATKNLYGKNKNSCLPKIQLPVSNSISELFTFCAEYSAAKILWPTHLKNIDYFVAEKLKQLIKKEKTKNLNLETFVIDEDSHCFTSIFGRIIMHKYPSDWQKFICKQIFNASNM